MQKKMVSDQDKIERIYNKPAGPSAFLGAEKLHLTLKKTGNNKPSVYKIRKWLQNQDDYSLQKPVRRTFERARVIVSGPKEQLDIDLADMQSLAKDNDGIKYLLVAVDVFSRLAWVVPLKDKSGKEVEKGLSNILDNISPRKIRSDAGSEFKNKWISKLLKSKDIYHHVTMNEVKANYVERFNKTLKTMIYRYLAKHRTRRYIDVLSDLVTSYNATPHKSLNNVAPKHVNEQNVANLWAHMYLKPKKKRKPLLKKSQKQRKKNTLYKYKIGQLVRISHQRRPFQRAYNEQWSYEVFKIQRRFQMQGIPMYKIFDLLEDPITGNFYQSELQPVDKSEDVLWEIESIKKKRKRNNRIQYFVKWFGYSDRFNSWVDESELKDL